MKFPCLLVNFKTYESATGEKALKLAKIHEQVAKKTKVPIMIAVQATDIRMITHAIDLPVFAEHFDSVLPGQSTGHITPESLKATGATGSLLNHAERRLPFEVLAKSIKRGKEVGLEIVVCAATVTEAKKIALLRPHAIAIEPPELIGGDISISTASPDIIRKAVAEIKRIPVLVGAGIKTELDVRIALSLGARGILLASSVTKSENPKEVLEALCHGFPRNRMKS